MDDSESIVSGIIALFREYRDPLTTENNILQKVEDLLKENEELQFVIETLHEEINHVEMDLQDLRDMQREEVW